MDEIASIWINTRLDLTGVERDLRGLDSKKYSLSVSVDDRALTDLNKHLDLKTKHFKEVQNLFNSRPLRVRVDDRELQKLNRINTKTETKTVNVKVNNPNSVSGINIAPISVDIDTTSIVKKLGQIQSSIARQSASSLFGNLLMAPIKLAVGSIGKLVEGVILGATAPIGEEIGRGIKDGITKESGAIIGSFEFISKKIAENLSSVIVDALEDDAEKLKEIFKIVGNYTDTDLVIENRASQASQAKREQTRRNAGINAVSAQREFVQQNMGQFQERRASLSEKRNELVQNYQKIHEAMTRTMQRMGAEELQKEAEILSKELEQNLQQLVAPTTEVDYDTISKSTKELQDKLSKLSDKLSNISETVKFRYQDFIDVLDKEQKSLDSEERRLIRELAPLEEFETFQANGIKATNKSRKLNNSPISNQPEIYQQVFEEVIKSSGVKGNVRIPDLVVNPNLSQATLGKYNPEQNQIQLTPQAYQQVLSGDVKQVSSKFFEILVHELRHAAQFDFGNIDAFTQRPNIELSKATSQELAKLGGRVELSTATTKGVSQRRVRELETDAYVFAERNAEQIRARVLASQFQQNMGVGGGKVQNLVKIESAQNLNSLKKIQQIAESEGIDITRELDSTREVISNLAKSIDPVLERAADVEILPIHEIEQLSEELMSTYQNVVASIQSQVNNVKKIAFERISQARQNIENTPQINQEQFKSNLNEQYTTQGLRQVVKRLGVSNYATRKKEDLIEIISQSNNQKVEEILNSLGDSIKKQSFKTNTTPITNNISTDSFKQANREIQNKLRQLKLVSDSERKQIVESLVIDLNKQINEIDKINESSNLSGKQSQQLAGFRSYFEQIRQPLSSEFIKNNSLNLPITNMGQQNINELAGFGDINEFIKNLIEKTGKSENTDETFKEIISNFEQLAAKFNISEAKFNKLGYEISSRYERLNQGTARVKQYSRSQREQVMNTTGIQSEPIGKFYANVAKFQESYNKFDRAESVINNRFFDAINNNASPIPGIINNINDAFKLLQQSFSGISQPINNTIQAFTGFFVLSRLIPILQEFGTESLKVAAQIESLETRIKFASGSASNGESFTSQLRGQAERLGLNQGQVLEQGANFLATSRGTQIEGQESIKGLEAINQASRVYNLTLSEQQRAQVALQQIVGKGVVSQEELRGQLAEALPGASQIAARAYGVTTQELNRMVSSGLDSIDFFRRFTQQLGIETSGGVAGALNTTQAASARFDSSMLKLQETFGKMLLPIQNMGLDILSKGLNLLEKSLPVIIGLMGTLAGRTAILATKLAVDLVSSATASQTAMVTLGTTAKFVGNVIVNSFKQFAVFAIIGVSINNLINSFRDLSGELRGQIDAVKSLQNEYNELVNSANKVKPVQVDDGEVFRKQIGIAARSLITGEMKQMTDSIKAIRESAVITQEVLSTASGSNVNQSVNQLKQIESQIEQLQIQKRALALNDPGNKEAMRRLNEQERSLLDQRNNATRVPDNIRKQLHSQAEAVKAQLEYLEKLKKEFPLYSDQIPKVNARIEQLKTDYDDLISAQEKLVKSISEGADAFALMQRNVKFVSDTLADMNDKNQIASNLIKEQLTRSVTNGTLSPQQENFRNQQLNIEASRLQANAQLDAIRQTQALINTPQNQARMQAFGVNETTGRARLSTIAEQVTNPQDKFLFEQLASLQQQKLELSNLRLQLAQAQKEARTQLIDLTKQVADFYRSIDRQAQETQLEIKKLNLQSQNQANQNKLKSVLSSGYDTIIGSIVEAVESSMNSLSSASEKAIDSQQQALQAVFNIDDTTRQGIELKRQIPEIKVGLDFSSIPNDNNVVQLREEIDQTIGGSDNLGESIRASTANTEKLYKQLMSTIEPTLQTGNNAETIRQNISNSNSEAQRAGELSNQWNSNITPISGQVDSINTSLGNVLSNMGNLLTQTVNWIAQLTNAPNLISNISNGINSFLGTNQQQTSATGTGFVSPLQGKSINELLAYKPSFGQSFYGIRDGGARRHSKIDFDARVGGGQGAAVLASISGIAKARSITGISGGVDIEGKDSKGNNITVVYNHLAIPELLKRFGKNLDQRIPVSAGERLGSVTMDSLSTGAHLDFGIKVNGQYVDPQKWMATEGKALAAMRNQINTPISNMGNTSNNINTNGISRGGNLLSQAEQARLTPLGKQLYQLQQNPNILAFSDVIARAEGTDFRNNSKNFGYSMLIGGSHDTNFSRHPFAGNSGSRIKSPIYNSTASGRYQMMDFNYSLNQAGRSFGRGARSDMSMLFQGENPGSFSPAVQDLYFIGSLKSRGILDEVLAGNFAGALQNPNIAKHYASLQSGNRKSAYGGQGTPEGQLRNTVPFAQQRLQARLRSGGQQIVNLANQFKPATPQQLNMGIDSGVALNSNTQQQRLQAQQDLTRRQQEADRIASETALNRSKRQIERSIREDQQKILEQRRAITDANFEGIAFPTIQQRNIKESTDNLRKYQDDQRKSKDAIREANEELQQAEKIIATFDKLDNESSREGLRQAQTRKQQAIENKKAAEKALVDQETAFRKIERARNERANFEEYLRQSREAINAEKQNNVVLQSRIDAIEKIKASSPTDPRINELPRLREELALNNLGVETFGRKLDAEEQLKKNGITPEEYAKRVSGIEEENEAKMRSIYLTKQQEERELSLLAARRELDKQAKVQELVNNIGDSRIKIQERTNRLNPFSIDTGELARMRESRAQNQKLINDINLEKNILDFQQQARELGMSNELVNEYIESLRELNDIDLTNLKNELSDTLDSDKLAEMTKVRENLATQFSIDNQPILDLRNAQADRYEQSGGNVFVSNKTRRDTARIAEMQARDQALLELDERVAQARTRGIDITDSRVAELRNNIVELSEIKLDGLNNQFKTVAVTLGDIAKQGIGQLSQGLADVIAKGGSLGDVFDNLFSTVLSSALNMGINSLFGGLFSGMFYAGGVVQNKKPISLSKAIQTEKSLSGREPALVVAHKGELMIPADRVQELSNMGIGIDSLLGNKSFAYGGIIGETRSREYGRSMSNRGGAGTLEIKYNATEIAGKRYVSEEEFQEGMMRAAEEGGKRGANIVTNKLANSPSYRRSLGL